MKKLYTLIVTAFLFSQAIFAQQSYEITNAAFNSRSNFSVLNNPAKGSIVMKINTPNSVHYDISLFSSNGQKITSINYNHPGGITTKTMYVPSGVKGMCYLVLTSLNSKESIKVFVQ